MRIAGQTVMVGLAVVLAGRNAVSAERDARTRIVTGRFVRLVERKVGDREYLGVLVRPLEGDDEVVVLMHRGSDLARAARGLRQDQRVSIRYVVEADHKWAQRIEAQRREVRRDRDEGDRDRRDRPERRRDSDEHHEPQRREPHPERGELAELRAAVRRLEARVEQMERTIRELRHETARLNKVLQERHGADARREADADALPEGLHGFRGMLIGTLTRKLDRGLVLKVGEVVKVWRQNKAKRPEAAIGREMRIVIRHKGELAERHMRALRDLKVGDRVVVEAFHLEGTHLVVTEVLRKAE